jgi:hypothetical protein
MRARLDPLLHFRSAHLLATALRAEFALGITFLLPPAAAVPLLKADVTKQ